MAAANLLSCAMPRGLTGPAGLSTGAASVRSRRIRAPAPPGVPPPRRPEYVPNQISDPNYVRIFDATLRESEQSAGGATMTAADKLAIARQLARLGVDIIEVVSFPASSPDNLDAARSIANAVGNTPVGEDGHVPVICALSRCNKEDIDAAWKAVRHARRPRINLFIATSEIGMERKLGKTPDEVFASATEMVAYVRSLGCNDVQLSAEDASRSCRQFLYHVLQEVIKAGATTLSILESDGYTHPYDFGNLIAEIKENTPGIENAIVSTNCQNGHGLATDNTLTGARAGARQLEVTINGFGVRDGNASLEEVVTAIKFREQHLGSLYTGINCSYIAATSKMVLGHIGLPLEPHKGIFGAKSVAVGSGNHQGLDNSTANDEDVNRNKALLGFISALTGTVFLLYASLVTFSVTYPTSQKALVTFDDNKISHICFVNFESWLIGSLIVIPFAAHFKGGKSIDHIGFCIFIWLLLLWLLFLNVLCCTTLHVFLKMPIRDVLLVGVPAFILTVFTSVPYIEYQRPTIVSKCALYVWDKIKGCYLRPRNFPRRFLKAPSWFYAKFSCLWGICATKADETLPSSSSMELESMESGYSVSP
ncbi:hypothetical protein EJB05_28749, partial [Eragrostis curvula]